MMEDDYVYTVIGDGLNEPGSIPPSFNLTRNSSGINLVSKVQEHHQQLLKQLDLTPYNDAWAGLSANARRLRKRRLMQTPDQRLHEKYRMKQRYLNLDPEDKERVKEKARDRYRKLSTVDKERVKERARERYRNMAYVNGRMKTKRGRGDMLPTGAEASSSNFMYTDSYGNPSSLIENYGLNPTAGMPTMVHEHEHYRGPGMGVDITDDLHSDGVASVPIDESKSEK